MPAVLIMFFAAILWSLYPLLISISDGQIGAPVLVILIHIASGVSGALFAYIKLGKKNFSTVWQNLTIITKSLNIDQWMFLSIVGLTSTIYNFCFIYSMSMTSKMGAAIIIEAWPIIAMFLAPILITKTWKKTKIRDYVAGVVALGGVALIILSDQKQLSLIFTDLPSYFKSQDFKSIVGTIVAMIGSVCLAISIILRAEISNKISKIILQKSKPDLTCGFIGESICRIVALPPSLFLLWAFQDDLHVTMEGVFIAIFIGVLIFNIGSIMITLALLKSQNASINMLYYISPVLAVLWLYMAGVGDLNTLILVGSGLVIASNLIVIYNGKDKVKKHNKKIST